MKKFIGKVNGKEFNDIKEFNDAVANVLKSDEPVSISSHYVECSDNALENRGCGCEREISECEECKEKVQPEEKSENLKSNIVDFDEFVIKDKSHRKNIFGDYAIPFDAKKKLMNASNKDEILKAISLNIKSNESVQRVSTKRSNEIDEEINKLIEEKNKLIEEQRKLDDEYHDAEHQKRYYETLKEYVNSKNEDEVLVEKRYVKDSDDLQTIFDDLTSEFSKYLKNLGFWM